VRFKAIILCLLFAACVDDHVEQPPVDFSKLVALWNIVSITELGLNTPTYPPIPYQVGKDYIVGFTAAGTFGFDLDRNTCAGFFEVPAPGRIKYGMIICDKVCCDSSFGQAIKNLLPTLTYYHFKGDTLVLTGKNSGPEDALLTGSGAIWMVRQ